MLPTMSKRSLFKPTCRSTLSQVFCLCAFVQLYFILIYSGRRWANQPNDDDDYSNITRSQPSYEPPLVFIGGCPRSGTTLMRVILDSHPLVQCGPETHILPKLLLMYQGQNNPYDQARLDMAGVDSQMLHSAYRAFILEIVTNHHKKNVLQNNEKHKSPLLCNKDPFLLNNGVFIKRLFPKAKFIYMIRDGRAVVNSIIERKIRITTFNRSNYEQCLSKWNTISEAMSHQCSQLGSSCLKVYYEKLVLNPKVWIERVARFLDIPWDESMLKHDQLINKGDIKLSLLERSTEQVIRPINTEPLTRWVGKIPPSLLPNISSIAPMLVILGYDPNANPPDYGKVNQFVQNNTQLINREAKEWIKRSQRIVEQRQELRDNLRKLEADFKEVEETGKGLESRKAIQYLIEQTEDSKKN